MLTNTHSAIVPFPNSPELLGSNFPQSPLEHLTSGGVADNPPIRHNITLRDIRLAMIIESHYGVLTATGAALPLEKLPPTYSQPRLVSDIVQPRVTADAS